MRRRQWLLAIGALLAAAAFFLTPAAQYDRSVENMFAPDDPVRVAYEQLTRRFAANEIVLAVYEDPELLDSNGAGFRRLAAVTERLRKAPGVRDVLSLAEINAALSAIDIRRFVTGDETPAILKDTPVAQQLLPMFQGMTHGADGTTAAVVCLLESRGSVQIPRQQTVDALREVVQTLPDPLGTGMVTGEPVLVADGFRFVEQDGRRLAWVSTGLIAVCIAVLFRSIRWMFIPMVVVQLSLLLSNSVVAALGAKLTLVSSMTAAVLTVIAVAAVVHVIVGVRRAMAQGDSAGAALERTVSRLAAPIFWSAATDAVGFGSLMISSVGPVRDYGWIMCIGSLLVLPAIWLLTPGLALFGRWDQMPHRAWGESRLDDSLALSSRVIKGYPRRLTLLIAAAAIVCCFGVLRLQVETDFTRSFRADNPLVKSYAFVEERLGGAGVWDVMLPAPKTLNKDYLDRVSNLQQELRALRVDASPAFTKVISLVDAVEVANATSLRFAPISVRVEAMAATMPAFFGTLRAEDDGSSWIRIMLRSRERQEAETKQKIIEQASQLVQKHFPKTAAQPAGETTGFFVLLSELVGGAMRDQWRCFALSIVGMGMTLMLALRSIKLGCFALLTNATPVLAVLGLTGWVGIKVNLGVAMIAAVALGLSVDSSLHFLFDYKRRRTEGADVGMALGAVQQSVGRAMLFATGSLVAGFLVLTTSPFVPTITFGLLSALAMIGGVAGNLVVLPLLLWLTEPREYLSSPTTG